MSNTQYAKLELAPNVPTDVTFEYDTPKAINGQNGVFYSYKVLENGVSKSMAVSPDVHVKIQKMGLKKGSVANVNKKLGAGEKRATMVFTSNGVSSESITVTQEEIDNASKATGATGGSPSSADKNEYYMKLEEIKYKTQMLQSKGYAAQICIQEAIKLTLALGVQDHEMFDAVVDQHARALFHTYLGLMTPKQSQPTQQEQSDVTPPQE